MTNAEILLLEKLIDNTVKKVLSEALDSYFKKELKDIKLLAARILKESRERIVTDSSNILKENSTETIKTISKTTSDVSPFGYNKTVVKKTSNTGILNEIPKIPVTMANHYDNNGSLPDIDAPIFFDPNSNAMMAFKEKYVNK